MVWRGRNSLSVNIRFMDLAVIKFSVYPDRGSCEGLYYYSMGERLLSVVAVSIDHCLYRKAISLNSVKSGYQHVNFVDSDTTYREISKPPPSLFIKVKVQLDPNTHY